MSDLGLGDEDLESIVSSGGIGDMISRILSSLSSALLAALTKLNISAIMKQLPKPSKMNKSHTSRHHL